MPSSISNSRPKVMAWPAIWLAAILLIGGLIASFELAARAQGLSPIIRDGKDLWSFWREQASDNDPATFVIIGASKSLMDIDLETLRQGLGDAKIIQLAIPGRSPVPVLADLAEDQGFKGTILCSFLAEEIGTSDHKRRLDPESYVTYYHTQWNPLRRFVRSIRTWLEKKIVLFHPQNFGPKLITHAIRRKAMTPWYLDIREDRSYSADYKKAEIDKKRLSAQVRQRFEDPDLVYSEQNAYALALEIKKSIDKIKSRGGRVILITHPSSGDLKMYESKLCPRQRYWDTLIKTADVPGVNAQDLAVTADLEEPDWEHLDFRNKPIYTVALVSAIRSKLTKEETS